jgi:hypothetical protein
LELANLKPTEEPKESKKLTKVSLNWLKKNEIRQKDNESKNKKKKKNINKYI